MNNPAIGSRWKDVERELFTPEERAASDLRVALIGELIQAREEKRISQTKLEELNRQMDFLLDVLLSHGKTLSIVQMPSHWKPLEERRAGTPHARRTCGK